MPDKLAVAAELFSPDFAQRVIEGIPVAIILVDRGGVIIRANYQAELLTDYHRGALIGEPVEMLVPGAVREVHQKRRDNFQDEPRERTMGAGLELALQRRDGSTVPVLIQLKPLPSVVGTIVMATIVRKESGLAADMEAAVEAAANAVAEHKAAE